MKNTIEVVLCKQFLDALDGDGTWNGLLEDDQRLYAEAMNKAYQRVYGDTNAPLNAMAKTLCWCLGLSHEAVAGPGRSAHQVLARRVIAYALRKHFEPTPSLTELARATGRTNHSSVVTNIRDAEEQIELGNEEFIGAVAKCVTAIEKAKKAAK